MKQLRLWTLIVIGMFTIGMAMGYVFNELTIFNARVNQVLAP
jgi:hypothetical protein